MLTNDIQKQIEEAAAHALASTGPHGVNVVPVSVVKVVDDQIYLYNFFMHKTVENINVEPAVALTCWTGLEGIQVKATATYSATGAVYAAAVQEMKERFPTRTLSGVLILTPTAVYDISADVTRAGTRLSA